MKFIIVMVLFYYSALPFERFLLFHMVDNSTCFFHVVVDVFPPFGACCALVSRYWGNFSGMPVFQAQRKHFWNLFGEPEFESRGSNFLTKQRRISVQIDFSLTTLWIWGGVMKIKIPIIYGIQSIYRIYFSYGVVLYFWSNIPWERAFIDRVISQVLDHICFFS